MSNNIIDFNLEDLSIPEIEQWLKNHFPYNKHYMLDLELEFARDENNATYFNKLNQIKLKWLLETNQ